MVLKVLIAFLIIVLVITLLQSTAFASEGFEAYYFRVIHSPTVCALEPAVQPFPSLWEILRTETEHAVIDWNEHLNAGFQTSKLWTIKLLVVPYEQQQSYDYSNCDIKMIYLKEFEKENANYQGLTYPFANGKSEVHILYTIRTWELTQTIENGRIVENYVPRYDNFASPSIIATTIRHEIGHAIGLGHYLMGSQEVVKIFETNTGFAPSIMVRFIPEKSENYLITQLDVDQVKLEYPHGFDGEKQEHLGFVTVDQYDVIVSRYTKPSQVKIYGIVEPRGGAVVLMITKPDGTTDQIDSYVTSKGEFAFPMVFDKSSSKGAYEISGKYQNSDLGSVRLNVFEQDDLLARSPPAQTQHELSAMYPVEGNFVEIRYIFPNGDLTELKTNKEKKSFIIGVNTLNPEVLVITLPRELIDAKEDDHDVSFHYFVDGKDRGEVTENKRTASERTLSIPLSGNDREIEIIGTQVIPEFGPLAILIAVISITCTVVISKRFSLKS